MSTINNMRTLITCALIFITSGLGRAEDLIVDWNGKGAKGVQRLNVEEVPQKITDGVSTMVFDQELSWRPVEGAEPIDSQTAEFAAGISASVGTSPAQPDILNLENTPAGGRIHLLLRGGEANPPQMRGILVFTKAHFLNGASDPAISVVFDQDSRLSFQGILDGCAPEARWLVRDGDAWWISEVSLVPQLAYQASEPRELRDLENQKWAPYDPEAVPFQPAPEGFAPRRFENITAVGIWFDSYGPRPSVGGTSFTRVAVDEFQARMTQK